MRDFMSLDSAISEDLLNWQSNSMLKIFDSTDSKIILKVYCSTATKWSVLYPFSSTIWNSDIKLDVLLLAKTNNYVKKELILL